VWNFAPVSADTFSSLAWIHVLQDDNGAALDALRQAHDAVRDVGRGGGSPESWGPCEFEGFGAETDDEAFLSELNHGIIHDFVVRWLNWSSEAQPLSETENHEDSPEGRRSEHEAAKPDHSTSGESDHAKPLQWPLKSESVLGFSRARVYAASASSASPSTHRPSPARSTFVPSLLASVFGPCNEPPDQAN
jgi:hypothetical protein